METPLEVTVLAPLLVAGYVLLARRAAPSRLRAAAFVLALVLVVAAFATRLQPLALHTFLWAHLLQNVVLAEWAPALLVLAVPAALGRRAARLRLFRPHVALPAWLLTYVVWHLPWVYDFALRHPHSLLH